MISYSSTFMYLSKWHCLLVSDCPYRNLLSLYSSLKDATAF